VAVPFVKSMSPSARAQAAGAPVEANISKLQAGQMMTVEWRGKPVWIVRRTQETLDTLKTMDGLMSDPASAESDQPEKIHRVRSLLLHSMLKNWKRCF
jgi:ubiquinol-cytochrome c reductase iron-sulfur subunit